MIEHRVLLDREFAHVRQRRGIPGLARWIDRGRASTADLAALQGWSARPHRLRLGVRVLLGSAQCRLLTIGPARAVRSLRDYETIAAHAFAQRLGLHASEWIVRVDPASAAGVVACAVRRDTMELAAAIAARLSQPLRSVQPWAALVLRQLGAQRPGVATVVREPGALLAALASPQGFAIRTFAFASPVDGNQLHTLMGAKVASRQQVFELRDASGATNRPREDFCDLLVPVN